MQLRLLPLLLALGSACSSGSGDGECSAMLGDPAGTPEIEIGELQSDGTWVDLPDEGAGLTLFTPPQGGKIALVGARIHNLSGCRATLAVRLRDPTLADEPVAVREGRTYQFVEMPERPGWGEARSPEPLDRGANLPACFNYADRDLDGCPWTLHVSVEDRDGRIAEKRIAVTPACLQDDPLSPDPALCECECAARYDLRSNGCNDLDPFRDVPPECG